MTLHRVFLSQEAIDHWVSSERAAVEGSVLTMVSENQALTLRPAVRLTREVSGAEDTPRLAGKVKDLEQLKTLGAEHYPGSIILGENAYETIEGFVGELDEERGSAEATKTQGEPQPSVEELELLAKLFLSKG